MWHHLGITVQDLIPGTTRPLGKSQASELRPIVRATSPAGDRLLVRVPREQPGVTEAVLRAPARTRSPVYLFLTLRSWACYKTSEPQFPHLQNGDSPSPITSTLAGLQQNKCKDTGKNAWHSTWHLFSLLPHREDEKTVLSWILRDE